MISRRLIRFTQFVTPEQVAVSLAKEQLRGWHGNRLVLQTRIIPGRPLVGDFTAALHY